MIPTTLLRSAWPLALLSAVAVLAVAQALLGLYHAWVFLRAPRRRPAPPLDGPPSLRIAVLVPARNEEKVVRRAVDSARALDYPEDLLDVYVIADNCTDATAGAASAAGAHVLCRTDPERRTKAEAIGWALEEQGLLDAGYDAFCILDADNVLAPRFLLHAERRLRDGAAAVQGRVEATNPTGGFASAFSTLLLELGLLLVYVPLSNRGVSVLHLGTGVLVRADAYRSIGWRARTLVEDTEFSMRAILAGERIAYCDEAVFYAEQPADFGTLWRQQRRWISGNLELAPLHFRDLARRAVGRRDEGALGAAMKLLLPLYCAVGLLQVLLGPFAAAALLGPGAGLPGLLLGSLASVWLTGVAQAVLIRLVGGRPVLRMWRGLLAFGIQPFFYGAVAVASMVRPKRHWDPIAHGEAVEESVLRPPPTPTEPA